MDALSDILNRVRGRALKVVLPEGDDPRILAGARRLVNEALAAPVVLGSPDAVNGLAAKNGISLEGIEIIQPAASDQLQNYGRLIAKRRSKMTEKMGTKLAAKPVYFGGAMLAAGDVQAMVAGVSMPTKRVIEAGLMTVGASDGVETPSSYFLMIMPDGVILMFADCALNIEPTPAELADIAIASALSRQAVLGDEARVAMLSFSTKGSGGHERVDKVRAALEIAHTRAPELAIDGELQADAALVADVAAKKGAEGPVAGHANVLVFPDLDSGNISYKLVQRLAGAQAIGPFLQGFSKPICDLSRGATVDDIVLAAAVSLAASD